MLWLDSCEQVYMWVMLCSSIGDKCLQIGSNIRPGGRKFEMVRPSKKILLASLAISLHKHLKHYHC